MLVWVRVPPLALIYTVKYFSQKRISQLDAKVTKQGDFERVVEVDVTAVELVPHFTAAYEKYQKGVKLEGFRKGKVPLGLIKKMYGDAIQGEVIDEVVQSVFKDVRTKEGLRPVAPAKLEDIQYDIDKGLQFRATVEVVPEIELKNYTGLSVEKEVYEVVDEDVSQALDDVRERMAVMEPVESGAEEGHYLVVDFQEVDSAGLPIIGKKFDDKMLVLNPDTNGALAAQLVGVKAGEKRHVELEAVDENGNAKENEHYEINVKEIKSKQLPELDDELAKDVGEFETLDALRADIRDHLRQQAETNSRRALQRKLIDELLKKNAFELPESMILNYLDAILETAKKEAVEEVNEEQLRNEYRPSAVWNLRWELAKDKLQELENITVTAEDKKAFVSKISKERGIPEKEILKSLKDAKTRSRVEDEMLEEKILDCLESAAKVKEKKITRKDIEKARQASMSS